MFIFSHPDLLDPNEWIIEFWIDGLQVLQSQGFVQNTLIERQGETCVYEFSMEQGLEKKCQIEKRLIT